MKKILALVLAAMMLLSCASALAEKTELTLWSIAVDSDANTPAYKAAIEAFNASSEEYVLVMEPTENETYKTKIKAAMQAGAGLPDIFFTWSMSFLGDFVEAGRVYCLDGVLPEFKDELTDTMLANTTYDGAHYGVPLTMNVVTLFANLDLLKKAGWDKAPETYEELMKCCDDLLAAGIIPFGVAGKENWCLSEYTEPLLVKTIGAQGLKDCYTGAASWDQEGVVKAMTIFTDMIAKGYFDPNAAAMGNEEVKQAFLAGKTAFYQNGSWNCGEIANAEGNFKCGLFPVMDTEKATLGQVIGGPNDALAVSASSANVELAAQAAFEIGRDVCRYGYLAGAGLPAWSLEYTEEEKAMVNPLSATVAEIVANADGMVLFGDNAMSANVAQTYLDYVALVYGCEIDGEGFVEGLTADIG